VVRKDPVISTASLVNSPVRFSLCRFTTFRTPLLIPLLPMIDESGSEVIEEVIGSIDFPKQERSGIRSNGSPAEIGYQFSRSKALIASHNILTIGLGCLI
jgi:hypothetical protein